MNLLELIPIPTDNSINTQTGPCPTSILIQKYGAPRKKLSQTCQGATSAFWKSRFVTLDVGPNRTTGHRLALKLMRQALTEVKERFPELYDNLEVECLCIRAVRGTENVLSNHGLGLAFDFKICGKYDQRGDDKCFRGSLMLYSVLKEFGFYWLAEAITEDAMHFEVGYNQIMAWMKSGVF